MSLPTPLLLPTPRRLTLTGQAARRPTWLNEAAEDLWRQLCGHIARHWDSSRIIINDCDSTLPPDGHRVRIARADNGQAVIFLHSRRREGLRHAAATLRQIAHQYASAHELPCLEIEDAPRFQTRGVMLDVSRDKVPTMAHLRSTIDLLASLKFNHLQLYTEHTFAYRGHEEVWLDASPITPSEARELSAYASARGIELAANQNCFGHLASWLKRPAYQHLAEIEGNNPWYFHQWERRGPFSLCPVEPKSETFVNDLLNQLLPCFRSELVNIGCDETFDVGWGRSKHAVQQRTPSVSERAGAPKSQESAQSQARAELYFEFVGKIAKACAKHNKRPMMWADIALTHPDLLHLMPKEMIGLAWWYEPTDKFTQWVEVLKQHNHEAWVCPGTSSWRSFTGRTTERRTNIADAAEQGMNAGAAGFLVCDWGDMGHRQQWPLSLVGIAQAAEAAWNPDRARTFDPRATAIHVFGASSPTVREGSPLPHDPSKPSLTVGLPAESDLGPWLDALGDCDLPIRQSSQVRNASALFNDLHPPVPGQLTHGQHEVNATIDQWQAAKSRLLELQSTRPPITDTQTRAELDHALTCALFAADHAVAMRGGPPLRGGFSDLISRAESIRAEHERLWLTRNRPGGLPHASSFYTKVIDNLRAASA